MKNPDLSEQNNRNAATRPFTDLTAELLEKCLNIPPGQISACRTSEDQLKGALVLSLHMVMVLRKSTS